MGWEELNPEENGRRKGRRMSGREVGKGMDGVWSR